MLRFFVRICLLLVLAGVVLSTPSKTPAQQNDAQAEFLAATKKGEKLWDHGDYAAAAREYERALRLATEVFGENHINTAPTQNYLAEMYREMGQYDKAEPLYQRSLQIFEAKLGTDHPYVAFCLGTQAALYQDMGQYAKAEPLLQRSIQIRVARLGKDSPGVAASLHELAKLYWKMGQYAKAEPLYQRSIQINEAKQGKDHLDVAQCLNSLAILYRDMGQHAKAEPLCQRSLQIREAKLGKDHPDVAQSLHNLALLYKSMGQYAKAEPLYQRSLQIREARLGKDHPDVARNLNNLASLYKEMGQYAKAEPLLQRSLQIKEAKFGKDHFDVARSLGNLAVLYSVQGDWQKAAEAFNANRRIVRGHVARTLPALLEKEQLLFLKNIDEAGFHICLSFGLARRNDSAIASFSAAWILNGKGVAQESLSERALLARDDKDPRLAPISRELANVRRQLATLVFAGYKPDQTRARLQQMNFLRDREQQLTKQLARAGAGRARDNPWVDVADVRMKLPDDAVLIEISRFNRYNVTARGQEKFLQGTSYAAWVIPSQGDIQVLDLGEAEKIEDAVWRARQVLQTRPAADGQRNSERERQQREPLEVLAKLVLQPLKQYIAGKERWLISPDGDLWLVPWGALPLGDGRYAIEKHRISYLVSGRDLLQPAFKSKPGSALVLADPDYDLGLKEAAAELKQIIKERGGEGSRRSGALESFHWNRLPGTAEEAEAIAPKLHVYTKAAPQVYTGKQALEGVFKAAIQPQVVVLSTHGFFFEDQDDASLPVLEGRAGRGLQRILEPVTERPRPHRAISSTGPLENPLLRCGLVLAGANNRGQVEALRTDDGLLSGLEIVGTDLRGTELVVLSACETGLGRVHNGEGVAGLRQAFQLAGAQTVVATLWKVPDAETAELMTAFFDNLAAGKGKADALREAQLSLIRSRRGHPFYWAAFTLTGQWK